MEIGEERCCDAIRRGNARLVLLASDASENAHKRAESALTGRRALLIELPYSKEALSEYLGKSGCSMAAATDFGLSDAFLKALCSEYGEKYAELSAEMSARAKRAAYRKGAKRKSGREHHE